VAAVEALNSASVQTLDANDQAKFFKIRESFDKLLKLTNTHCQKYAPIYVYVADCVTENLPVQKVLDYLAMNDFNNIIKSAEAIQDQSFELCVTLNSFIQLLKTKYSHAVFFNWQFLINTVTATAGVGMIVAGCIVPGAQPLIFTGAGVLIAAVTREAIHIKKYLSDKELDARLLELLNKLDETRNSVRSINVAASSLSEKLTLVMVALGVKGDNPKHLEYLKKMCTSYEDLDNALRIAIDQPVRKFEFAKKFANMSLAAGVGASIAVATAQVITNTDNTADALEVVAHSASTCIIL